MIRGRFEEAWYLSELLEKESSDDLRHKFNRGWFIINQGNLQEGFQLLEAGRFLKVYGSPKIKTNKPIWNQTDTLKDKTVLINLEGGLGDQIISARFAKEVYKQGGKTILCGDIELHPLLLRIIGVNKCITQNEIPSTRHDYWIPGFSCSWLFGHT